MRCRLSSSVCALLLACSDDGSAKSETDAARSRQDGGTSPRDAGESEQLDGGNGLTQRDAGPHARADGSAQPAGDAGEDPVTAPTAARYFAEGAFMYQRIDGAPLDPDSKKITAWLQGAGGFGTGRMQIDFSIEVLDAVSGTPRRAFEQTGDFYTPDCDPAPFPVPVGGALEGEPGYACTGDGDCHLIVVDRAAQRLYEMWRANIVGGTFHGGCAAIWDMSRVYGAEGRGEQCSSADAAGFPIAPLLFSAGEVAAGSIDHAIRFILPNARMREKTYQHPANHAGGPSGPVDAPIYGSRWRLRADYDIASLPTEGARVVARALQRYGMALADGGNIALTAQSDRFTSEKWQGLLGPRDLAALQPSDFEIVQTGEPIALTFACERTQVGD